MSRLLKISSRKSALARIQTYLVSNKLRSHYPDLKIEYNFSESIGDKDLQTPLWQLGSRGVFTKDLTNELLANKTDLVVHSWKDLEIENNPNTRIVTILNRADSRDVLFFKKKSLYIRSKKIRILTSSPRREYNLKSFLKKALPVLLGNKEIIFESIRGNVQTRVAKWQESQADGLIVAKAAIDRMFNENYLEFNDTELGNIRKLLRFHLSNSLFMCLPLSENPNAPAQGAIAIEYLIENNFVETLLQNLIVREVQTDVGKEREILKKYGGGCHQKIGVSIQSKSYGEILHLRGITDQGEILSSNQLKGKTYLPKPDSKNQIWPNLTINKTTMLRTEIENIQKPMNQVIWVSRKTAWPSYWSYDTDDIIWTAGLETWFALAGKNIWINGTADGLGEAEVPDLDCLLGKKLEIVKLTHSSSDLVFSNLNKIFTYNLSLKDPIPDLSVYTHFYWMNGHFFDLAFEKYSEHLKKSIHSCGPGITFEHICKRINDPDKVFVFLNYKAWLEEVSS